MTTSSQEPDAPQTWSTVVTSYQGWFHFPWRELWHYRDMILLMVRRDLIATYKQTVLGPVWLLIQPIISSVVFTIIFSGIGQIPTNGIPPFLFYLSGNLIWYYFSACLTSASQTFRANAQLFTKVYFPRLAMPLAQSAVNLWHFGIQFLIFVGFYIYFFAAGAEISPSYRIVIIPALVIHAALLGLGTGCIISALTTRFRDLQIAVAPGIQLWMYASCIFYPRSIVPEAYQWIMTINPVVPIVEAFRFALMGQGQVEISQWLASLAITIVILLVGLLAFGRAERTMADTI